MPAQPPSYARLTPVLVPERHRRLLAHLRASGSASVDQLAQALDVSAATIRRDLVELAADGRLLRARGGAYLELPARPVVDPGDTAAKDAIGRAAAELVVDGSTVMILGGSTTQAMVGYLARRSLTVVTNGLDIAHQLAGCPDIELVLLGGYLHREQMTLLGSLTDQNMAEVRVDQMFAGAYGVHPRTGVTGSKIILAGSHHLMLGHTNALIILADGSKLGRQGPTHLARLDQVDTIVTSDDAPPDVVAQLREQGATVSFG